MNETKGFAGSPPEGAVKLQELLGRLGALSCRRRHDVVFEPAPMTDELMIVVRAGDFANRDVVGSWSRRDSTLVFQLPNGVERTCESVKEAEVLTDRLLEDMLGPIPK